MKSGIYLWTNKKNGKRYVGKAENLLKRRKRHLTLAKMYMRKYRRDGVIKTQKELYLAFIEDGFTNFKWEILERCSMEVIDEREQYWIKHYDTYENGYNMLSGFRTNEKYKEDDYGEEMSERKDS